ncbi:hypothetical protein GNN46_23330 [Salmonella enterica]|nr:hypothetical protein [Salmonella enterica]
MAGRYTLWRHNLRLPHVFSCSPYIFDPKRQAVLLCGGSKQGKSGKSEEQFYKDLIKVAEAEYSKYLQQLQEEENDRD